MSFPKAGTVADRANIVTRYYEPVQVKAGVVVGGKAKYGLHSLRHFYASWSINRRADDGMELPAKVVQERLGHSTIAMTLDRYGHLFPRGDDGGALDQAAKLLLG